jgi:rubrerythrin
MDKKGKLRLCKICGSTFVAKDNEDTCPDCRTMEDDNTKTFGSVMDGLKHPF